jgi:hypothetical protein
MKAAVELLAEATDVIGSQSRQEVAGIKHKRYAFVEPAPCITRIAGFCTATTAERGGSERSANRRLMTKT